MEGRKDDQEKTRWDLVPWQELTEVADVLTIGAKKYEDYNWQKVPHPMPRYYSAALRHLTAWFNVERKDQETGKSHLAHAICCLLFLMWFDKNS